MNEIIRKPPERRIDDLHAILKGRKEVEGRTESGTSFISKDRKGYSIDIPSHKPGLRIFFVIDHNGKFLHGNGYYETELGSEPKTLEPMDINIIEGQITRADQFIDETIGTFQENTGIDPRDKEIATEEETEKIKDGIRRQVITITDLTPKFCKTKSGELQTKKSEVPPIVVNSFSERDWEIVIKKARKKIREENCEKLSL